MTWKTDEGLFVGPFHDLTNGESMSGFIDLIAE